jgi:hypothetical protein
MKKKSSESIGTYADIFFDAMTFNATPLNICEINCTSKSVQPIKALLIRGGIKSYVGLSTSPEIVQKMKNEGCKRLTALLIKNDEDIIHSLDELKEKGHGRVIIINYPESFKEKAKEYERLANERGLDFKPYPLLTQ